jgi:hypothetical protein
MTSPYIGAKITNVRRGKGARQVYIYAQLQSASGEILISATLDYIMQALRERVSASEMIGFNHQMLNLIKQATREGAV